MSERRRRPSRARDTVSLVFSFFLSIALVAEVVLLIVHVGLFSEKYFLSIFDDQYYEYVLSSLNERSQSYTLPTGIDPKVLEGVFTKSEIERDVRGYVNAAFIGIDYDAPTSEIEERLSTAVEDYLTTGGVTQAESAAITKAYVDEIMQIYHKVTKMPGLDSIAKVRARVISLSLIGVVAAGATALVLAFIIMRLHHFPHRGMRYLAYATGGAALMCFAVPFALKQSGAYLGLNLTPQYFYHFGVSFIEHVLNLFILGAGALALVTALLIALVALLRRNILRHKGHHGAHHVASHAL